MIENIEGRNSQLLHKLQKLEQEHEDLVERNEELESILGEKQIQTQQEKEHFENEVEGLHQKVSKGKNTGWFCLILAAFLSAYQLVK